MKNVGTLLCSVALLLLDLGTAHAGPQGQIEITWLGHAAYEITSPGGTKLLLDPFLTQNPSTPAPLKKLDRYKPAAILLTHSHGDHVGDAVAIAKASKAKVIGEFSHVAKLEIPDDQKSGGNVGGRIDVGDVQVHLVPAMHGSEPGGRPLGFVLKFTNGEAIYATGDTWIFGDMALIQEIHAPTIILLQAGGGPFNQSPEVAKRAIDKFFKPKHILPMHYGTWPILATKEAVQAAFKGDDRVRWLDPGQSTRL